MCHLKWIHQRCRQQKGIKLGKITVEPQEVEVTGDKSTLAEISEIDIPPSALKLEELTQRTEQTIDISSYLSERCVPCGRECE